MRMHVCWGNYEGPHTYDVPLEKLLPEVIEGRSRRPSWVRAPRTPAMRMSGKRSATSKRRCPEDKLLVPGVLSTTTNYVEHPELVAQRLEKFAEVGGPERVLAGTDCGFGNLCRFRAGGSEPRVAETHVAGGWRGHRSPRSAGLGTMFGRFSRNSARTMKDGSADCPGRWGALTTSPSYNKRAGRSSLKLLRPSPLPEPRGPRHGSCCPSSCSHRTPRWLRTLEPRRGWRNARQDTLGMAWGISAFC